MAIIVTIHYQAFAENSECALFMPFKHLDAELSDRISLEDIRAEAQAEDERTYLFVLDCSASVEEDFLGPPSWYQGAVSQLRQKRYAFSVVEPRPTAHSVSKIALYSLLDALVDSVEDRQADAPTDRFAVWDVCGGSMKKVPRMGKSEIVSRAHLDAAIEKIEEEVEAPVGAKSRTSFLELLQGLDSTYRIYEKSVSDEAEGRRSFVLTIISDFEDDPDGGGTQEQAFAGDDKERQRLFVERERELIRATRNLSSDNITINLVAIALPHDPETNIIGFVRKHLRWYRYNKVDIMSDIVAGNTRLLYPVEVVERRLRLWYSNPLSMKSEVRIQVQRGEDVDIALPAVDREGEPFELTVGSLIEGYDPRIEGRVRSGEQALMRKMSPGEWILMRYQGRFRAQPEVVRIFDHSAFRAYLVSIDFVRRLSPPVAWHLAILVLIMLAPVAAFLSLGVVGRLNYRSKS